MEEDSYEYDVFLSYTRGFIDPWIDQYFLRNFEWHLYGSLGRRPKIFLDRLRISTGDSWPYHLKKALAHSRCLVAIWSPSYFESQWCMKECCVMLHRERKLGLRSLQKPTGLLLPVNVSDGDHFPDFAKTIHYFDCRDFVYDGQGFAKTETYIEFQKRMREWAKEVAGVIKSAPAWNAEWLDDPIIEIPETKIPSFGPPTLD